MKFFEYLAAGVPVVATAIPSLERFRDSALLVAPGADQLESAISQVLQGQGPDRSVRIALARRHTYRQRTQSMLVVLEQLGVLAAPGSSKLPLRDDVLSA